VLTDCTRRGELPVVPGLKVGGKAFKTIPRGDYRFVADRRAIMREMIDDVGSIVRLLRGSRWKSVKDFAKL